MNLKNQKKMTAKEAREYAQKQLSTVQGKNKELFDAILAEIQHNIDIDATRTYITMTVPPRQVIAWLEAKPYLYETQIIQVGPAENELKISWAEEGIKQYGNGNDYWKNR